MGIVYKARHLALGRLVALKMILRGPSASLQALARFRTEAHAVAKLRHPNIVQIYEVGECAGQPYFSLEYVEGGSLQDRMEGAPQPPDQAARLLETLARAVHHAHGHGVIHRDLKPGNILLASGRHPPGGAEADPSGGPSPPLAESIPKITDFGLAKRLEDQDQGQTSADAVLGTPTYMAPEQAAGKTRDVGPSADVYALGAILYDLLTGRPPHRGATLLDTLQLVQNAEPVPPRRLAPKVPPDLQTICLKCLEKEPRRRYASAEALADDLHLFLEGRPIAARPVSAWERTWKWARRRPAEALLLAVCVLALAGLLAGLSLFAAQQKQLAGEAEQRARLAAENEKLEKARRLDLEQNQQKILRAQKETESQRDRAQLNLGQARLAVTQLIDLAQKTLPDQPGQEAARERILNFAQDVAEKLLKQQGQDRDPSVRWQAAQTKRLVGDIQETLEKPPPAAQNSYEAAAELYEGLLKEAKVDPAWRQEAAGTYLNLWVVLAAHPQTDGGARAAKALAQAEKLLTDLVKDYPKVSAYKRDLALCWNNRGLQEMLAGRAEDSERCFKEALLLFEQIPGADRKKSVYQLELARTEKNLGVLYHRKGRIDETKQRYKEALSKLKALVQAEPDVTACHKEMGLVYISLGALLANEGFPEDAKELYGDAILLCERLDKKFSAITDYRRLLALAYAGRGDASRREGKRGLAAAQDDLKRARRLVESLPDRPSFRLDRVRVLNALALVDSEAGNAADAGREWQSALELCEGLLAREGERAEVRAEFHRACRALIDWRDHRVREEIEAKNWPEAAVHLCALLELRQKRLDSFRSYPEALAAAAVGPAAALIPGRLEALEQSHLAMTRLALARVLVNAGLFAEAGDALDDLARFAARWDGYPEAAALAVSASERVAADRGLSEAERMRQADAFRNRALALLGRADEQDVAVRLNPRDFGPLLRLEEFRHLRDSLARKRGVNAEP
jgi:tetratricopeptide (TPR) repeat protein